MGPEKVKLILQCYIQCKQSEDECDSPGNLAVECDTPRRPTAVPGFELAPNLSNNGFEPQMGSYTSPPPLHSFPFGFEPPPSLPNNAIEAARNLARMAQEFSVSQPDRSIIKFKETCMIKEPIEQIISIPVVRDEKFSDKETNVSWKTIDKTAISGTHYIGSNGELIFNQGDTSKDIQIQILKSADATDDLRFTVELNHDGLFTPKPMTVSLKKIENLEPSEQSVLQSLRSFGTGFSVSDVKYALDNCLNARTFHMGLTHLCSTTSKVDAQIALACELSSMCLSKSFGSVLPENTVLKVLSDFLKRDEYDF